VRAGRPGTVPVTTAAGNTVHYRQSGDGPGPVIVLENGLAATGEYWEWIVDALAEHHTVVTYERAGYGPSTYSGTGEFTLDHAAADLADVVRHVAGSRPVVLVGHSVGGYLALRAAERLGDQLAGIGLLDSSHPAELRRSSRQGTGAHSMTAAMDTIPVSLRLGLGALLPAPAWIDRLPEHVRSLATAHFRDHGVWTAGRREWAATRREFTAETDLPRIDVPVLVVTAGETARQDPIQATLHDELAAAAPTARRHTVERAGHFDLLADQRSAATVADLVADFVTGIRTTERVVLDAS
jgi:pimeloyl-ACP methyl ester carboxylesterase